MSSITPCLWFETQAAEAAEHYTSIFPNSRIVEVTRHTEAGPGEPGSVLTVTFTLDGEEFVALNGGPHDTFNDAISLQISCESQEEVDHYWTRLSEGGQEVQCGWLKDRYGLSWQVVPTRLTQLLNDPDPQRSERAMRAMLQVTKIDIAALEDAAAAGVPA